MPTTMGTMVEDPRNNCSTDNTAKEYWFVKPLWEVEGNKLKWNGMKKSQRQQGAKWNQAALCRMLFLEVGENTISKNNGNDAPCSINCCCMFSPPNRGTGPGMVDGNMGWWEAVQPDERMAPEISMEVESLCGTGVCLSHEHCRVWKLPLRSLLCLCP